MKIQQNRLKIICFLIIIIIFLIPRIYLISESIANDKSKLILGSGGSVDTKEYQEAIGYFYSGEMDEENANSLVTKTPGYPAFIAGLWKISYKSNLFIAIMQLTLDLVILLLIITIIKQLTPDFKAGVLGGGIYAVNPITPPYVYLINAEILFLFFLLLSIFFFIKSTSGGRQLVYFAATGLTLGLATITKPIGVYLIGILLGIMCIKLIKQKLKLKQILLQVGLLILLFSLVIIPVQLGNKMQHDVFSLSSVPKSNLMRWNAQYLYNEINHKTTDWPNPIDTRDFIREITRNSTYKIGDSFKHAEYEQSYAIPYIMKNSGTYFKLHIKGIYRQLIPFESSIKRDALNYNLDLDPDEQLSKPNLQIYWLIKIYLIIFAITSIIGIIMLSRYQPKLNTLLFLLFIAYFLNVNSVLGLCKLALRHMYPVFSLLTISLAVGITEFAQHLRKREFINIRKDNKLKR